MSSPISSSEAIRTISAVVKANPTSCTLRLNGGGTDLTGSVTINADGSTITLIAGAVTWSVPLENVAAVGKP